MARPTGDRARASGAFRRRFRRRCAPGHGRRAEHLVEQDLAERQGQRIAFSCNLIDTLRRRELEATGDRLAAETGRPFNRAGVGEYVAGAYRQRVTLASGRFAMIDDSLGFQLVPWTHSLEKQLGKHVSGVEAIHAVFVGGAAMPARVRVLVDFLAEALRTSAGS